MLIFKNNHHDRTFSTPLAFTSELTALFVNTPIAGEDATKRGRFDKLAILSNKNTDCSF
jgi:hypothetical protein